MNTRMKYPEIFQLSSAEKWELAHDLWEDRISGAQQQWKKNGEDGDSKLHRRIDAQGVRDAAHKATGGGAAQRQPHHEAG